MKTLATLLGIVFVALAGFAGYQISQPSDQPDTFGAFRPSGYSGKLLTRLNSGGSESSFNTTPCTTPDGQTITANAIGDFTVITVNPGAANEEKISASTVSCSGTTLTWTITNRGLSFASATSTITANKKQHAIGETVIISNDDQFLATQYVDIDSSQIIAALKTFTSGAMFSTAASSTDECTGTSEYCTKNYIDNSVNQGAATSTEAIGGIVELATATEQASSTPTTANIPYVLQAQNATSTPAYSCNSSGTIGALCTVIARNSGKIHQLWIDLTESFTWTGAHIFSSTLTANGGLTSTGSTSLATTTIAANTNLISKAFGGDGSGGALTCTTATTTIDIGSAAVIEKNYSSISITGDCAIEFSNPASTGSIVVFRSQGDATITSSKQIYLVGVGGVGGGGGAQGGSASSGGGGGGGASASVNGSTGAATSGGNAGAAGTVGSGFGTGVSGVAQTGGAGSAGLTTSTTAAGGTSGGMNSAIAKYIKMLVLPGSGGGGGAGGNAAAGTAGARGAGAIYIEVGGKLNITSTINASGTNSAAPTGATGGCGGGGGGGSIVILYNFLTTNSGAYTVSGGSSGGTCNNAGGAGANGYSSVTQNTFF